MLAVSISSSGLCRATNDVMPAATSSGSPITAQASARSTPAFSCGVHHDSMSSMGGGIRPGRAAAQAHEALLLRGEQPPRLLAAVGCNHVEAEHRVGRRQARGGAELRAVHRQCLVHLVRGEVRGERERQPQQRRQLRAEQAGAQQPHRHVHARARHRLHGLARLRRREVAQQLLHVLRKAVGTVEVAAQRPRRGLVGARRPPQAQVDAARVQTGQRAELLGHLQRRMVGQHDPAGTHADRRRAGRDMADQHRRGGAGDARHVVVFGQPVAPVPHALGVARQVQAVGERL